MASSVAWSFLKLEERPEMTTVAWTLWHGEADMNAVGHVHEDFYQCNRKHSDMSKGCKIRRLNKIIVTYDA